MINRKNVLLFFSLFILIEVGKLTDINRNEKNSEIVSSSINPPECGKRPNALRKKRQNRIIGGQKSDPEDWGWQVLLEYKGKFLCGGSLINKEWIITAAHCIISKNLNDYKVRLGVHDRSNPEVYSVLRTISKIIIHPEYVEKNFKNDIALMKLSFFIEYSNYIVPICLPSKNYDFTYKNSWATGWGSISEFQNLYSNFLMEINTVILNKNACYARYQNLNPPIFDSSVHICAGNLGNSICFGDSGGPLVVKIGDKWQLAGISSWILGSLNFNCFDGGAFTKASIYVDWIKESIQGTLPSASTSTLLDKTGLPNSTLSTPKSSPIILTTSVSNIFSINSSFFLYPNLFNFAIIVLIQFFKPN